MHLIVGTVPDMELPLVMGEINLNSRFLTIENHELDVNRGTSSLAAASWHISRYFNMQPPVALLAGDDGSGIGSRKIYKYIIENVQNLRADVITFHYLQPDVNFHDRIFKAINDLNKRPVLVADAGFMYVAKMSGKAFEYDLFTPDVGELAYLADENAPHPFYTRGFLLNEDLNIPEKISRAYGNHNASKTLLVKGKVDYVAQKGSILEEIREPMVECLEPVGGTGDTITGMAAELIHCGFDVVKASIDACRINRMAGRLTNPTPATQVREIINNLPFVFREVFNS